MKKLVSIILIVMIPSFSFANKENNTGDIRISKCTISLEAIVSDVTCYGGDDGSLELLISGGKEPYQTYITNKNTLNDDQFYSDLTAGTYIVEVTDADNCIVTESFTIEEPPYTQIDLGPDIQTFSNMEVSLDAGSGYKEYMWSNGEKEQTITYRNEVLTTTIDKIFVEVIDQNNCLITSTEISIKTEPHKEPIIEEPK